MISSVSTSSHSLACLQHEYAYWADELHLISVSYCLSRVTEDWMSSNRIISFIGCWEKDFFLWMSWGLFDRIWVLLMLTPTCGPFHLFDECASLCFFKSRVNSGYLWIRLHVRACLAIFTKCWRPHSVSWSRPEKQHPQKRKKIKSQISSVTSNTKALKHAVISAERSEFVFADSSFSQNIQCNYFKL